MEQAEVKNLKLNVTNINSFLVKSNNQLKRIRVQKKRLIDVIDRQNQRKRMETKIEAKNIGSGFKKLTARILAKPKSIFEKIKEFFSLILIGFLVNKLPQIIDKLKQFFNSGFIKAIGSVLMSIGKAIFVFVDIIKAFPKSAQDAFVRTKDDIERQLDEVGKLFNPLLSFFGFTPSETKREPVGSSPSPSTTPSPAPRPLVNPAPFTPPLIVPGYSKGGVVKPNTVAQTGQQKASRGDATLAFSDFYKTVNQITQIVNSDEENTRLFAALADDFKEYTMFEPGKPGLKSPLGSPLGDQGSAGKTGSFASGAYIGNPGDTDGEQTGLNMNLPGGIGTPIYAPFDMIYRSKGTDGNPSVGLQGTAGALGPAGRGFGYYGAYYFKRGDKEYEVLMGHFRDLPFKGVDGQVIPKGTLLGYQGASGRSVSGDGGVYPHISLHVNGVGFRASNSILGETARGLLVAKPSGEKSIAPVKKDVKVDNLKNGGRRSLNRRNRQVIYVGVQKIQSVVPMPIPVPVQMESKRVVRSNKRLSSVWSQ